MSSIVRDQTHFFVVNLGRSGSSLLSAVLADAGADFGVTTPSDWDPRTGQMEGVEIKRAAHHYRRVYDISYGRKFILSPALETSYRRQRARAHLRRALAQARFHKISDLDLVVQPSFKLGITPRVILNYRQLECMLPSLLVGRSHDGADRIATEYLRVYRQGITLVQTFGGCVVAYNELQDVDAKGWAQTLATVTDLDSQSILQAREQRLKATADANDLPLVYDEAFALFTRMRQMSGQVFEPSRQVQRALESRSG